MSELVKTGSLTRLINSSMKNLEREIPRDYIGASSIGNPCERAIWYKYKGHEDIMLSPKQQRIFSVGKKLESIILDCLENAGLNLARTWYDLKDSEVDIFKGHVDAMWLFEDGTPRAIIEVKTARDSSFNIFLSKGLKEWSSNYYAQVQSYMGMSGVHGAYVVALNKDTSDLHDEHVLLDKDLYEQLKSKAKRISESENAPPKINNSPLFYICRSCPFKLECHK
jgi:hypothetical protein